MPRLAAAARAPEGPPAQHHLDVMGAEDYKTNPQDVASLTHGLEHLGYRDMVFWRLDTNLAREAQGHDDLSPVETQLTAEELGKLT